jgi:hypothetical protein
VKIIIVDIIRKNIRLLFVLFLPVYFLIVHQSLRTKHAHFFPNGVIIVHAHPVSHQEGMPLNEHSHSKTEICFYHLVNIDYHILTAEIVIDETHPAVTGHVVISNERDRLSPFIHLHNTRGPPVLAA